VARLKTWTKHVVYGTFHVVLEIICRALGKRHCWI
jgi:hypothetical protein